MLPGLALAADARGPSGRFEIKEPEIAVRPGVVEFRVKRPHGHEFALHLVNDLQGSERFRAGHLAEVHAQVIMSRRRVRAARDELTAGGNAFVSTPLTLVVLRG